VNPPQQFSGLDQVARYTRPLHLAIGMYDGVHLGHQAVIESAIHSARRSGGIAGVLTFWPHPSALFNPEKRSRMIMSPEMKFRVLHRLGVDVVIQQPFTLEFARIEAEEFLPCLKRHLPSLAGIYVGENWRFGAGRRGDVALLLAQAREQQVPVLSASRIQYNGGPISSTRIRECLEAGNVAEANSLLGYSYFAEGEVIPGRRLGRTIGFPTLNLAWQPELQPRHGVYAVRVVNGLAGASLPGVANYGLRPTVGEATTPLLEVHVLGECPFDCGDRISVEWLQFLRPECKFAGLEELRAQIARDVEAARAALADFSLR
jgi:riboflavin kinase/FMN adenylyltransferase